jgi:archaellum component FlaC
MDKPPTSSAALRREGTAMSETGLLLKLQVTDPEVLAELNQREGAEREKYALTALRVGVLALRQAGGFVDAEKMKKEGELILKELEKKLQRHTSELDKELTSELEKYFDPKSGHFAERVGKLVNEDGELSRLLKSHLVGDSSLLARELAAAVGDNSPLMKHLDPSNKKGLVETIARIAQERLEEQSKKVLGEFSLDNEQGALSRLVKQIETNFNPDDPRTALGVLKKALAETQEQIRKDLSLDADGSALSNMHGKLKKQIEDMVERQAKFQTEVGNVLSELRGAKKERAVSPSGGFDFESLVGDALRERVHSDEVFESVGETTGLVPRSKVGDHVQTLGAESAAPGAKIVYECKRADNYTRAKALAELDEARKNRGAEVGVFVLASSSLHDNARMQAEFPQSLARQGNDIIVVWDPESDSSDVSLDAAVTLARALVVRERSESDPAADVDWDAVDRAIHGVQRQIEYIDELDGWCGNIKRDSEKVADRLEKMKKDLSRELERLTEQIAGLRP